MKPLVDKDDSPALALRWHAGPMLSVVVLVLANLIPLAGVIFWDWTVFSVMLLFWMENVVVGLFNVLRMLLSQGDGKTGRSGMIEKFAAATFFTVHYGLFTGVHGMFVLTLFGFAGEPVRLDEAILWQKIVDNQLHWPLAALVASHGFSFLANYIGNCEYRTMTVRRAMKAPYDRVVVLHLAILAVGFLLSLMGSPEAGVVLLVILKTVMDVRAHRIEHGGSGAGGAPRVAG